MNSSSFPLKIYATQKWHMLLHPGKPRSIISIGICTWHLYMHAVDNWYSLSITGQSLESKNLVIASKVAEQDNGSFS